MAAAIDLRAAEKHYGSWSYWPEKRAGREAKREKKTDIIDRIIRGDFNAQIIVPRRKAQADCNRLPSMKTSLDKQKADLDSERAKLIQENRAIRAEDKAIASAKRQASSGGGYRAKPKGDIVIQGKYNFTKDYEGIPFTTYEEALAFLNDIGYPPPRGAIMNSAGATVTSPPSTSQPSDLKAREKALESRRAQKNDRLAKYNEAKTKYEADFQDWERADRECKGSLNRLQKAMDSAYNPPTDSPRTVNDGSMGQTSSSRNDSGNKPDTSAPESLAGTTWAQGRDIHEFLDGGRVRLSRDGVSQLGDYEQDGDRVRMRWYGVGSQTPDDWSKWISLKRSGYIRTR